MSQWLKNATKERVAVEVIKPNGTQSSTTLECFRKIQTVC